MTEIKRYNGREELDKLLKSMPVVPSNTEIVEKTSVSKGSVSQIMLGKRTPTKKFVDKFIKGFKLQSIIENPPPIKDEGLKDKMIALLEKSLKRVEAELERALEENKRLNKQ
jgi:hypothetical protein